VDARRDGDKRDSDIDCGVLHGDDEYDRHRNTHLDADGRGEHEYIHLDADSDPYTHTHTDDERDDQHIHLDADERDERDDHRLTRSPHSVEPVVCAAELCGASVRCPPLAAAATARPSTQGRVDDTRHR
jgi:hypothetical protein